MGNEIDALIDQAVQVVDRPAVTALLSEDAREKPFIAEGLVIAAVAFLIGQYAAAYLRGLGLDELGERHGRMTRASLDRLRRGTVNDEDLESAKRDLVEAREAIRELPDDLEAASAAKKVVSAELTQAGLPDSRAAAIADGISDLVRSPRRG